MKTLIIILIDKLYITKFICLNTFNYYQINYCFIFGFSHFENLYNWFTNKLRYVTIYLLWDVHVIFLAKLFN